MDNKKYYKGVKNNISTKNRMTDPRLDSPDNIYLEARIVNERNIPTPLTYSTTRNTDIISKASDYYLAVGRFSIPNDTVPLFIFQDLTYSITMVNGAAESRRFLQYVPNGIDTIPRGIYQVQIFLDMINDAITLACGDVGIIGADIPYVYLDLNSQLQVFGFSNNANWLGTSPTYQLWLNWRIYEFFTTLPIIWSGSISGIAGAGKDMRIIVKNNGNGNTGVITNIPAYYRMSQETALLNKYLSSYSIIIGTNTLPIQAKLLSIQNSSTSASISALADFIPSHDGSYSDNFTPYAYNPAFYKLIDFNTNGAINKVDFQVFYSDRDGNLYPITLLPGQRALIELVFVKKSLYNNMYDKP